MNNLRLLIGGALALLVTFGLFVLMPTLIETADKTLDETKHQRIADIVMPEREIETNLKEVKPEKPEDPEEPPPELDQPDFADPDISPDAVNIAPSARVDINIGTGVGLGSTDGEYLPIVKVAPIYPRRAQSRGVTGYCIVEYTVTKTGAIRDPQPVDCQPSGYFESASVKAALKFKYKPRVVDGEPIDVFGVQNKFTYELDQ
ncbi:MAG TPA: energy transducer TonB [Spongiibacteraceae bacterium]|jgi:protein TonB|nr:energy transducer TonB [Spongiibacteraceae bacterium]